MIPYKTTIFPYWHYVEKDDMPKESGKYLIFWDDTDKHDGSYLPHYEIATYLTNQHMWRLSTGVLLHDKELQVVAWQELPCLPIGRKYYPKVNP